MNTVPMLMVVAAVLPYGAALCAKAGGTRFDNRAPRAWLAAQTGWRARANAAQANSFEALPFFFAAVLYALHVQSPTDQLVTWMGVWLFLRLCYVAAYIMDRGTVRSIIWAAALVVNVAILLA